MTTHTCPNCGNHIGADHPHGLCPACLLKKGLESQPSQSAPLQCPACQSALAEDARFCARCGVAAPAAVAQTDNDPLRRALETKLQGQYRLGRLLGRGGMGAVYLARDLTLEREVAIKVIKTSSDSQEMYDRFRREARTSARLSHPNIVPLHAFGEVEGLPYFVMGYVRGESLADRLRRDGKLPEEEARRILAQIADALDHAHRQGVVHRDIKPDNVLLEDESGRALLTDFGVAKAVGKGETLTQYGSVVGTPQYMSPEQASGRGGIDGRSDIYSLGVMAYAILAGRLPFDGSTAADILTKHMTQEPPPLRSLSSTLSDSTVQAVERCLAKDPARRWPDAHSLKIAMGQLDESQLPDALQGVEGHGIPGAAIALVLLAMIKVTKAPDPVIFFNAGVIATIYISVIARLRMEGFSIGQSQRTIWTEPAWWPFWYPRRLRRRGNVWDRLPATVRQVRWWPPAFVLYFLILFTGTFPNLFRSPLVFVVKLVVGMTFMTVWWIAVNVRARRELRRKGLAPADFHRVMISIPPSRVSFWARPHIAALLSRPRELETGRRSDSPHDQLQSILRHADELAGPLRPLGAQAAVAARQLVESIGHADKQISDLARNLEPGEEARLIDKIEALTTPSGGSGDYAPLRSLLEKQLELVRGLSASIEEVRESRNRRVEMLKTLGLHVASLRARLQETPSEVGLLSDNVRALCDDIGRQAMAPVNVATIVTGDGLGEMPTVDRAPKVTNGS